MSFGWMSIKGGAVFPSLICSNTTLKFFSNSTRPVARVENPRGKNTVASSSKADSKALPVEVVEGLDEPGQGSLQVVVLQGGGWV